MNQTDILKCKCQKNFYGKNCENKVNICQNQKCSSHGVCYDNGLEPKCKCFIYYYGDECQYEKYNRVIIRKVTFKY